MIIMKDFMTLSEQIDAIRHADEASMIAYLENYPNPHFLALANVVASGNVNVCSKVLEMDEVHTVAQRTMLACLPDNMHHLVRNHKSYKEIDANVVFPGSQETFIEMLVGIREPYEPDFDVDSPEWIEEFNAKKDDPEWQMSVIDSHSIPHVAFLIINSVLDRTVINTLINYYSTDEDKLSYVLSDNYDEDATMTENLMTEASSLQKFLDERNYIFKLLSENQEIAEDTAALICWLYASGYMELEAFQIFYEVEKDLPTILKYRFRFFTLEKDEEDED
jgi:hypothetical protein